MAVEYTPAALAEIDTMVARGLPRWRLPPSTAITLLNVSENATFLLRDPAGPEWVLRVHRVGHASAAEIRSEIAWMAALRRDGVIETAAPVPGIDGDVVQILEGARGGRPRFAVAFERLPGREPQPHETPRWFERLGELTAAMHVHAKAWTLPAGFQRKCWDVEAMVGPEGRWGPWRAAAGLDAAGAAILERAVASIRERLGRLGREPEHFGLVHADLRLANLLVDGAHLRVIDFDDCGFGWFGYDFAAAVSFIEQDRVVPELLRAWCAGYGKRSVLPAATRTELPTFVVLRRILLTAWIASHGEVPAARDLGAAYARGTVALAKGWLRGEFLTSAPVPEPMRCPRSIDTGVSAAPARWRP